MLSDLVTELVERLQEKNGGAARFLGGTSVEGIEIQLTPVPLGPSQLQVVNFPHVLELRCISGRRSGRRYKYHPS